MPRRMSAYVQAYAPRAKGGACVAGRGGSARRGAAHL